jgi:ribonuclease Z
MLNLEGCSLAGYATWLFHQPSRILFDCGEGCAFNLKERIFAVETILLSHGHLDHISGLPSFFHAREFGKGHNNKPLRIIYPKGSLGVIKMKVYLEQEINNTQFQIEWIAVDAHQVVEVGRNLYVYCFPGRHIEGALTLGFQLFEVRRKLKEEYSCAPVDEIIRLKQSGTPITNDYKHGLLTYSGDTVPLDKYGEYDGGIFCHECTFLNKNDIKYDVHSSFDGVMEVIKNKRIDALFLYHISIRYALDEIHQFLSRQKFPVPVYYLYENKVHKV